MSGSAEGKGIVLLVAIGLFVASIVQAFQGDWLPAIYLVLAARLMEPSK